MKLHLIAVVLVALFASDASAQPPVLTPPPATPPFVTVPYSATLSAPMGVFPTARPMFRAPKGVFLFDSGNYLLGGSDGLARSSGAFTMSYQPPPNYGPFGYGVYPGSSGSYTTGSIVTAPTAPAPVIRP